MKQKGIPPEDLERLIRSTGAAPQETVKSRRQHERHDVSGTVAFHRADQKDFHRGELTDISEGGMAFLTEVSLHVGELLVISCQIREESRTFEARVETVHTRPEDRRLLVGCRFVK